jgi:hypothetical protein
MAQTVSDFLHSAITTREQIAVWSDIFLGFKIHSGKRCPEHHSQLDYVFEGFTAYTFDPSGETLNDSWSAFDCQEGQLTGYCYNLAEIFNQTGTTGTGVDVDNDGFRIDGGDGSQRIIPLGPCLVDVEPVVDPNSSICNFNTFFFSAAPNAFAAQDVTCPSSSSNSSSSSSSSPSSEPDQCIYLWTCSYVCEEDNWGPVSSVSKTCDQITNTAIFGSTPVVLDSWARYDSNPCNWRYVKVGAGCPAPEMTVQWAKKCMAKSTRGDQEELYAMGVRGGGIPQEFNHLRLLGATGGVKVMHWTGVRGKAIIRENAKRSKVTKSDCGAVKSRNDLPKLWKRLGYSRVVGGMLCGHDYLDGRVAGYGVFGVKQAVDEWAKGKQVFTTFEHRWKSWYCYLSISPPTRGEVTLPRI